MYQYYFAGTQDGQQAVHVVVNNDSPLGHPFLKVTVSTEGSASREASSPGENLTMEKAEEFVKAQQDRNNSNRSRSFPASIFVL